MNLRTLAVAGVVMCSCATPYAQVKDAKTIDAARALLKGYEPAVTKYSDTVEAWYFGKNECVLFVDGVLRLSSAGYKEVNGVAVSNAKQDQVLCTPSKLND